MEEKGEGGRPVAVLPPLDLHILQSKVAGGRLPPGYGLRDEYNCIKLALCQLCSSRLPATHEALKQHVECARHQAKLGRVIVDQRTLEEFRAGGTPHQPRDEKEGEEDGERFAIRLCTACEEDRTVEDVAAPIIHHPRRDAAEGREVKHESEGYLVRIYRCGTVPGPEADVGQPEQLQSFTGGGDCGAEPLDPAKA